jgi:hypothetical protein
MDEWMVKSGESSTYIAKKNIGDANVMRLIPTTGKKFKLDGIDQMVEIEAVWEDYFNQTWDSVKEFLK